MDAAFTSVDLLIMFWYSYCGCHLCRALRVCWRSVSQKYVTPSAVTVTATQQLGVVVATAVVVPKRQVVITDGVLVLLVFALLLLLLLFLTHYCCSRKWNIDLHFDESEFLAFDAVDSEVQEEVVQKATEVVTESIVAKTSESVTMAVETTEEKSSSEQVTTMEQEEKKTFVITGA